MTGKLPAGVDTIVMTKLFGEQNPYLNDPVGYIEERLGCFLWSKQKEICQSVADHRFTAVQACHGVGKSFVVARLAAWWIATHPIGEALVVWTAPTFSQVNSIIGQEIRRAIGQGGLPGRLSLKGEWYIGDTLVGIGRKPGDYNVAAFSGLHRKYILVIVDEACGVPETIFVGVDTLMTNEDAKAVAIGNPDNPNSHMAKICTKGHKQAWDNVIRVNLLESPNFTDEEIPDSLRPHLTERTYEEKARTRWGPKSALYMSKVLGLFPDEADDALIARSWVEAAHARELDGWDIGRYGVDVARYGDSETVIYRNRGGQIRLAAVEGKTSGPDVERLVKRELQDSNLQAPANIDADGIGGPVYDHLVEDRMPVFPFHGGHTALDPKKFKDRRSEMYWTLRELLQDGALDLDPEDEELTEQLCNIKWSLDPAGRIRVETKDEMRKRKIPSPDRADGVMMSVAHLGEAEWKFVKAMRDLEAKMPSQRSLTGDLLDMHM